MKKIMESLKIVINELRREIDIYLTIQRYSRLSRKHKSS